MVSYSCYMISWSCHHLNTSQRVITVLWVTTFVLHSWVGNENSFKRAHTRPLWKQKIERANVKYRGGGRDRRIQFNLDKGLGDSKTIEMDSINAFNI